MSELAIRVENLGKKFLIGHRLEGDFRSSVSRKLRDLLGYSTGKTEEEFWALKHISLDVLKGEAVGIIGKNGAGKSTLLKILSRITDPTAGRFEINGRVSSLLEVGTGFHPELTGRENIYLNGTILGMRRVEIRKKFDSIVSFSGVEKFIDTAVKHYSSGMKVRLAFSVAAYLEPEILIVDEVLAVGDAEFQQKCLGKMDEVRRDEGRTIFFVSHNLSAIEQLCKKGVLLEKGRLMKTGDIHEVVAAYLDTESMFVGERSLRLSDFVHLKDFTLSKDKLTSRESIEYNFSLFSSEANRVSDLALLIYNHLNERIGIIDLRHEDLFNISNQNNVVNCGGRIERIGLVEGSYHIGLYISSSLCHGDFLNLATFEVKEETGGYIPYSTRYRGFVEFNNHFSFSS
jgi:homopolymeric O-antigen transport system ATP-binding protein